MSNIHLRYTNATIYAIIAAALTLVVTFGLHLTQDNIRTILTFAGLVLGVTSAGAGVKSAGMIKGGVVTGVGGLHFTPALVVSLIGAAIAIAVTFGLHVSQQNIQSIMTLVGLLASGVIVGGSAKSHAMFVARTHPALRR